MTTLCIAKAFQPGKLALTWLRYCSSVSPLKSEAGGSTLIKENSFHQSSLDIPPVLFIAKYNRLIETADFSKSISQPQLDLKEQTSPRALKQGVNVIKLFYFQFTADSLYK
jgi:hypothetical protein